MYVDDHNRIILNPLEDYADCQGGFVNACYIDVGLQQLWILLIDHAYVWVGSLRVEDVVSGVV